ncbi:MAG: hypothetical protein EOM65_15390, partial [Synergistales bacterium]|nr:hypothetical protein [Synergistales bacterium]
MEDKIAKALEDLRNGRIVLLYDFDDREKETDMVVASEFITPDGAPYDSAGATLCDPGHALEWVGLTALLLWIG